MEVLRIRIPNIHYCSEKDCYELSRSMRCRECTLKLFLNARVRQEMPATTLPRQSKIVHSTPLTRFLSG